MDLFLLIVCWFTDIFSAIWHTVGGFGIGEIRKSLAVQGFFVLVVSERLHCWEKQHIADGCAVG